MKVPIVKEHGSWIVFILSSLVGIFVGLSAHSVHKIPIFEFILTSSGLALLINSKRPLTSAFRAKTERIIHIYWFLVFSLCGLGLITPFLIKGIMQFLVFIPLIIIYVVLLLRGKEHNLIAELIGFALLCLSAPIIYFILKEDFSFRLYLVVFMFFAAGVFKLKVRVKRTLQYRATMIIYCVMVLLVFLYFNVSTIILLPLVENIVTALWIREEKLKTTGNIELLKGVIFTLLLILVGSKSIIT